MPHRAGTGLLGAEKQSPPNLSAASFPFFCGLWKLPFAHRGLENYEEMLASHKGVSVCVSSQKPLLLSFNKC